MIASVAQTPADSSERLELLLRENALLAKQNSQLDKAVARMQTEHEALSQRALDATELSHTASARLRAKEAEVDSMSTAYDPVYIMDLLGITACPHMICWLCLGNSDMSTVYLQALCVPHVQAIYSPCKN